jgi:phosphoribosyl 1,2-cyclic phosphodiesterase
MNFFVKFWGTRGSIPTPGSLTQVFGGNTPCIEIRVDDALFVCDGGSGLRELGLDLLRRGKKPLVVHMFFSHAHWDHIQGFPFFVPAFIKDNSLVIYGTSPGDTKFHKLLSGQMESDYFPVAFGDLGARVAPDDLGEADKLIEGVRIKAIAQLHHGPSYGYSFEKDGRKVVYATDNELDLELRNAAEAEADPDALRGCPERYVEFCRGARLLIADGQYTDAEYKTKRTWGHPRATTLVDLAFEAGVEQLAITHHDPLQSDDQVRQKIDVCRARAQSLGAKLTIFGAREGMELRID